MHEPPHVPGVSANPAYTDLLAYVPTFPTRLRARLLGVRSRHLSPGVTWRHLVQRRLRKRLPEGRSVLAQQLALPRGRLLSLLTGVVPPLHSPLK